MAKPPQPPARKTMEVEISWLEKEPKKPPRMPGATVTVPPLPVTTSEPARVASNEPPRRNTIDVEMEWVELVDEDGNVVKKLAEKK